jgi:hypothetical protein
MPQLDIMQFDAVLLELMLVLFAAFLLADADDDLRNLVGDNDCWTSVVALRAALWLTNEQIVRNTVAINFVRCSSDL